MPSRKKRPVLFEVVGYRRPRPKVWSERTGEAPPPDAPAPAVGTPPERHAPLATPPAETSYRTARERSIQVVAGRVLLNLGWPELTVVGVFALVLLVGAFQVGRRSALPAADPNTAQQLFPDQPTGDDNHDVATPTLPDPRHRQQQLPITPPTPGGEPRPEPITDRETQTPPPVTPPPAQPELLPGHYYVVAQFFPKSRREQAEAARDFLRNNGVAVFVQEAERDLRLMVEQPFANQRAAAPVLEQVRKLGQQYNESGGGYDFAGAMLLKTPDQ